MRQSRYIPSVSSINSVPELFGFFRQTLNPDLQQSGPSPIRDRKKPFPLQVKPGRKIWPNLQTALSATSSGQISTGTAGIKSYRSRLASLEPVVAWAGNLEPQAFPLQGLFWAVVDCLGSCVFHLLSTRRMRVAHLTPPKLSKENAKFVFGLISKKPRIFAYQVIRQNTKGRFSKKFCLKTDNLSDSDTMTMSAIGLMRAGD